MTKCTDQNLFNVEEHVKGADTVSCKTLRRRMDAVHVRRPYCWYASDTPAKRTDQREVRTPNSWCGCEAFVANSGVQYGDAAKTLATA